MEYLKWLPIIPYITAHPQVIALVQQNLPEAQQFLSELNALMQKHAGLIKKVEDEVPEITALANQLTPVIRQIEAQS